MKIALLILAAYLAIAGVLFTKWIRNWLPASEVWKPALLWIFLGLSSI